jgi:hypothetical protein
LSNRFERPEQCFIEIWAGDFFSLEIWILFMSALTVDEPKSASIFNWLHWRPEC